MHKLECLLINEYANPYECIIMHNEHCVKNLEKLYCSINILPLQNVLWTAFKASETQSLREYRHMIIITKISTTKQLSWWEAQGVFFVRTCQSSVTGTMTGSCAQIEWRAELSLKFPLGETVISRWKERAMLTGPCSCGETEWHLRSTVPSAQTES